MNRLYAITMWATHIFVMLGDLIVTASILAGLYLSFFGDLNLLGIFLMGLGIVGAIWAWKDDGGPFFAWRPSAFRQLQQHLSAATVPVPVNPKNNTRRS